MMPIWVVYFNTSDYPGKYVTRKFINDTPTNELYLADTLNEIRYCIPCGLIRLDPYPQDDPVIIETWF